METHRWRGEREGKINGDNEGLGERERERWGER